MGLIFETFCPQFVPYLWPLFYVVPICGQFCTARKLNISIVGLEGKTVAAAPEFDFLLLVPPPPPHQTCFYIKSSNFSSFLAFYFSLFCFLRICRFHVVSAIVYLFCAGIFISLHNGSSSFILINQCKKTK